MLPPTGQKFEKELPPDGTHLGLCFGLIDLGTREKPAFDHGSSPKKVHEVVISFELPDERMKDGRPLAISKRFTYSLHEKSNLFKILTSWIGKPFVDSLQDKSFVLESVLGKPAMLTVQQIDGPNGLYAKITAITGVPKSVKPPEKAENPHVFFSIEDHGFAGPEYAALKDGWKRTIEESEQWKTHLNPTAAKHVDDDIPF